MDFLIDRRSALKAGAALAVACLVPARAQAQAQPTLRFAAVFSDRDIRASMIEMFAKEIAADFKVEPFYNGSLFKQGTELVALQRNNLELGNIAPQDISNQLPAWSILTSAYLFRDADHLNTFFASDLGAQMKKMVEDQVKVKILGPTFFGTRQVGLKPKKKITTPADMAGIKLRMPGGDAWQFLGRSLGANPTPMAYAEVYTGLQTGAIDGQDNPLPNVQNMKFYEVMSQIVLTAHLVGLRPPHGESEDLGEHGAGQAEGLPGGRRQGHRLERRGASQARGGAGRHLPEAGPRGLRARRQGLPRVRPEDVSRAPTWPRAGRPACSRRSTPCSSRSVGPFLGKFGRWLRRRAEDVLAAMLAVMFLAFLLQIVFRYLLNFPVGWTSELTVIAWLWGVLWGAAFVVREREEVRFDLLYGAFGARTRRIAGIVTGVAIVALYAVSLPATLDYVRFMKVERTAYLKIRFDYLFSIYVVFVVAVIVRYVWILSRLFRGKEIDRTRLCRAPAPRCDARRPVPRRRRRASSASACSGCPSATP